MNKKNRYCKGYTAWLAHAKRPKYQDDEDRMDEGDQTKYRSLSNGLPEGAKKYKEKSRAGDNKGTDYNLSDPDEQDGVGYRGLGNTDGLSDYKKLKTQGEYGRGEKVTNPNNIIYNTPAGPEPLYQAPSKGYMRDYTQDNSNLAPSKGHVVSGSGSISSLSKRPWQYSDDSAPRDGWKKTDGRIGPSGGSGWKANETQTSAAKVISKPSSWAPDSSSYRDWKKKYNRTYYKAHKDYWRMYYGVKNPKAPSSATSNMYRDEAYKQAAEARARAQYDRTNYDRRSNAQKMLDRSARDAAPEKVRFGKELFNAKTRLNDLWAAGAGSIANSGRSLISKAKNNRASFNDMWANGADMVAKAGKSFLDAWKAGLGR